MNNDYENRIYSVLKRVLRTHSHKLSDQTRRGDIEEWDSLGHILLIAALSEEFKVTIPAEQALQMETIQDIKRIIGELKD